MSHPPKARNHELSQAVSAYQTGDLQLAQARISSFLRSHPRDPAAWRLKAMIEMANGNLEVALTSIQVSLEGEPANPDGLTLCAHLYLTLGRLDDAEFSARKFVALHPNDARAHSLRSNALGALGRLDEALAAIDRSLALNHRDPEAFVAKARLLMRSRSATMAIACYRRALSLGPSTNAATDLARILLNDSHPEEALAILEQVLPQVPTNRRPHTVVAQVLTQLHRFEEADAQWILAEEYCVDRSAVMHCRADSETAVGRFDVAEAILTRAIEDGIDIVGSFFLLSRARKMTASDLTLIDRMESLANLGQLPPQQLAKLHYALGKSYDDLRDFERAIKRFDAANAIDWDLYPIRRSYRHEDASRFTELLIKFFTPEKIHSISAEGLESCHPLFIIGMVRSGTTLTENILGAHSEVKPGGEQLFWPQRAPEFLRWAASSPILDLDLTHALTLAREYLSQIDPNSAQIRYVSDKNPANVQLAMLLHGIFPNAKMVHLKRQPVDNLLSMWMTPFGEGVRCASNRENLVNYYREYQRLADHLPQVVPPDRLMTLRYEDLTSEPESMIQTMLHHLGLKQEPKCFEPEKNMRTVLTPSVFQVRQPIHRNSQARWRNYEPWLGPFAELLD